MDKHFTFNVKNRLSEPFLRYFCFLPLVYGLLLHCLVDGAYTLISLVMNFMAMDKILLDWIMRYDFFRNEKPSRDTLELAFMGIVLDSVSLIVISLAVMVAIRIVRRKIRQGEQKYMLPYFIRNLLWIILGFGFLIFHLFEESWYGNAGTQVVAFLFSIVDIVFKLSTCYILFVLYVQMNFQDEIAKRIKILTYLEWLVGEDSDRPGRWTWAELELLAEEIEENDGHLTRRARRVLELSYPNTERPELPDLAKFAAGDDSKIKFEFYEDLGHADADHFFEDEVLDENVMDADMAIFMHGQFYGAPVRPRGK